jgi:hypothetical protein
MEALMTGRGDSNSEEDCLTVGEAYLAMFYFVDSYWKRGGRSDGSVTLLRNDLGPLPSSDTKAEVETTDPAFWSDWLEAIRIARAKGIPGQL